jgi:hypothetical protein
MTHLVSLGAFRVVEREEGKQAVPEKPEREMGEVTAIPSSRAVDKILAGSISRIGETYIVLVRGIDAPSGVIEIGDQVSGRSLGDLVDALSVLADRLVRKARGERLPTFRPVAEPAPPERSADLEGTYRLSGRNADRSAYRGLARITRIGSGYRVLWRIGAHEYRGTGIRIGDRFTVSWGEGRPITYEIRTDGVLEGTWDDGEGSEVLTPA